jgi:phosphate transport system permease protein
MSGIPTVVYGYFALNFISPLIKNLGNYIDLDISTESSLSAGIVIGIMIIPLITSLVDDILHSIPKSLYYGAAALGSTQTEIILRVMIPYSFSGIFSMILLAFSRAIGETMIVLMLTGVSAHLDFNPLHSITTITVQIVTILTGDQTFNSPESLSAYALGLTLFVFTWILNSLAITLVNNRHA